MTRRSLVLCAAFALASVPLAAQTKPDPKSPIKEPTVQLSGSLNDLNLAMQAPVNNVIVTAPAWERLAETWRIKNPPKVDFKKEFLVVGTSRAGQMVFKTRLDDQGDLRTEVIGNGDTQGGFRYAIRSVKLAGVKTVNGKPLPVE